MAPPKHPKPKQDTILDIPRDEWTVPLLQKVLRKRKVPGIESLHQRDLYSVLKGTCSRSSWTRFGTLQGDCPSRTHAKYQNCCFIAIVTLCHAAQVRAYTSCPSNSCGVLTLGQSVEIRAYTRWVSNSFGVPIPTAFSIASFSSSSSSSINERVDPCCSWNGHLS